MGSKAWPGLTHNPPVCSFWSRPYSLPFGAIKMAQSPLIWTDVDSSNVGSVAFDEASNTLVVRFNNGAIYSYEDVEMDVYIDLVHAESVGRFLNQMIKGRYAYLKWASEQDLMKALAPKP